MLAAQRQTLNELRTQLADKTTPEFERGMLEAAVELQERRLDSSPDAVMAGAATARLMLGNWKYQRLLYDRFGGGRILFQQFGPEAFDATHNWIKKCEDAGDFTVTDPELRTELFAYWTTMDHGSFLSNDAEDFLNPDWLGKPDDE